MIEILFGMWTQVGSRNYAFCGAQIPAGKGAIFGGGTPFDAAFRLNFLTACFLCVSFCKMVVKPVIGVSQPPILDCGTTFHLDYGGRDNNNDRLTAFDPGQPG